MISSSDTPKTSRQLQAEHTKRQIFDAAMYLLHTKGYEAITIRDIVQEANVSIGSFYNAYPSKHDVFFETYQIADEYFMDHVAPALTEPTVKERLRHFFREYASYNADKSRLELTKLLFYPNNKFFHRSTQGMISILTELVRQGQARGEITREQSAEVISEYMMISLRGLVYDWCICDGSYDLVQRTELYGQWLLCSFTSGPRERIQEPPSR